MAEKKPAAKKPAAKAAAPVAPAKKLLRPSETKTSGVFVNGVELGNADAGAVAQGEVISRPSGSTRVSKKKAENQKYVGTVDDRKDKRLKVVKGEGVDTKELTKVVKKATAEEEAARTADRIRKGAGATPVAAPKAGTTRRGTPRAAGEVVETKVKRTPSARAVQRRAISAKEQAKLDQKELTANDYLGPKPKAPKDLGSAVASASDLMTGYSQTNHGKAMKHVEALDKVIGPNGSNLPASISPETRQALATRMTSVRLSHQRSYNAAVTGDPVFAMRHMHDANETMKSIGQILQTDPNAKKTRELSVARDVMPHINRHNDVVAKTLTSQKKNMSIETTSPEWKTADTVLGLRNENTTAKTGPYAGLRPAKDFRTPDARNPQRGHALLSTVHSVIAGAMSYTRAPSVVASAQKAAQSARFFGDSVEMGDTAAVRKHGQALIGHLNDLHAATKEVVGSRPNFTPQMRDTVTANMDRHLGHASFRINEILGEK